MVGVKVPNGADMLGEELLGSKRGSRSTSLEKLSRASPSARNNSGDNQTSCDYYGSYGTTTYKLSSYVSGPGSVL